MSERSLSGSTQSSGSILTSASHSASREALASRTPPSKLPPLRNKRKVRLLIGAGVALAVIIVVVLVIFGKKSGTGASSLTATAEMGELVVKVIESGEIEAERRDTISNELRWPVFIASVVTDGTQVKKGDLIVKFECKELMEAIDQQKITVENATNECTQAEENMKIKKQEVEFNVYKAEQDLAEAKESLRRYEEGDWPTQVDKADSDIKLAEQDLVLAKGKLDFKKRANADPDLKQPYSDSDIKAEELSISRLELSLSKAKMDREILEKYENAQKLRKYKLDIMVAELTVKKAETSRTTEMMIAQANVDARKSVLKTQENKQKDLDDQYKKLEVFAQRDGLVVYRVDRWSYTPLIIEVGAKVDPRQQIMIIPDMTSLQIKTKVYEAMIDQVAKGAEAYVKLDAKPDAILSGKVERVAVLPDSQNWMNPSAKVYNVYIKLDETIEGLKPNMTAQCEMVLARLDNVLSVPVAAVFADQEQRYCFRTKGGRCERVAIKTGHLSDTRVEVLSGLNRGDVVLLNPPQDMINEKSGSGDKDKKTTTQPKSPRSTPAADKTAGSKPSDDAKEAAKDSRKPKPAA